MYQSRLEAFYEYCMDGNTAVMTTEDIKKYLQSVEGFDWEEFGKPFHYMDIKKLADSLKDSGLGGKWKNPQAKGAKPAKQAISKYTLDKSYVMGIGSGWSGSALLIRGLCSKFGGHPYKFGDAEQQQLLQEPIADISQKRKEYQTATEKSDNYDPVYSKKVCTVQMDFELCSAEDCYQSPEALEQLKYLYLIQHVIAFYIVREATGTSPRDNKIQVSVKGCIYQKYDDFKQTDVFKSQINLDAIPNYHDGKACELVYIKNSSAEYKEEEPLFEVLRPNTITQFIQSVYRQNMDVLLVIDSCVVKKVGREVQVMPKVKAMQVVIKKDQEYTRKHIGLRLVRP